MVSSMYSKSWLRHFPCWASGWEVAGTLQTASSNLLDSWRLQPPQVGVALMAALSTDLGSPFGEPSASSTASHGPY